MKQVNITIHNDAHEKLKNIKRTKGMTNPEVMEFLINEVHKALFNKEASQEDAEARRIRFLRNGGEVKRYA